MTAEGPPEARRRLEVVGEADPAPDPQGGEDRPSRAPRRIALLLGVLLLLACVALGLQTRRAEQLAARADGLEADLGAARQELSAYRGQLGRVRILVEGLGARVDELRELVGRDPRDAQGGADEGPPSAPEPDVHLETTPEAS